MAGGHSAADMTPEVSELTLSLKASIEAELEATFDTFDPVSMTQQVRFYFRRLRGTGRGIQCSDKTKGIRFSEGVPDLPSLGRSYRKRQRVGLVDNVAEFRRLADNVLPCPLSPFSLSSPSHQVVAGMVYHVKVNVGSEHIHARIFKPLPHTGAAATVQKAQAGFSAEDPIAPL